MPMPTLSDGLCVPLTTSPTEVALVQGNKTAQSGFDGGGLLVQFVPIKWVANLRAQGVPRAQTGGLQTKGMTFSKNLVPDGFDHLRWGNDLKPVLASVSGSGDVNLVSLERKDAELVLRQTFGGCNSCSSGGRAGETDIDEFRSPRPLQGDR